jgi:hypothetical protein
MAKKKNEEYEGDDADMDYEDEPDFSQDPAGFEDDISDSGKKKARHRQRHLLFTGKLRFNFIRVYLPRFQKLEFA